MNFVKTGFGDASSRKFILSALKYSWLQKLSKERIFSAANSPISLINNEDGLLLMPSSSSLLASSL